MAFQAFATAVFFAATALNRPIYSQVEKVVVKTTGISCGICAVVSEMHFRRMPDVRDVAISLSQESITLSYKESAAFDPRQIRQILQPLDVEVVQFRVTATGFVIEERGNRVFLAGKDKFLLPGNATIAAPLAEPLLIEGILNDRVDPAQLRILTFKPLKK